MKTGELYSTNDLAEYLEEPVSSIAQVLEFLSRYGFVERVTLRELIFRKHDKAPSPGEGLRMLRGLLAETRIRER